jgi:hypothetical protein
MLGESGATQRRSGDREKHMHVSLPRPQKQQQQQHFKMPLLILISTVSAFFFLTIVNHRQTTMSDEDMVDPIHTHTQDTL